MNLTTLQMQYIKVDTLKDADRLQALKGLYKLVEATKRHDNVKSYYNIFDNYRTESDSQYIYLFYDGVVKTTFTKWSQKTFLNRLEQDIYYIEYIQLQNQLKELYHIKLKNKWINAEQYNIIIKTFKAMNLSLLNHLRVKKDKITSKIFAMFEDNTEIVAIKDKGQINYIMDQINIKSRLDVLKERNTIDLKEISAAVEEIKQMQLIKVYKLIGVDKADGYKTEFICNDRIDNNIETVKEYYNKNVIPECIGYKNNEVDYYIA